MNVLALAWRNLCRNPRRMAAALMTMVVGVAALLLFGGYARGIHYGLETSFVRSGGQLQVQHRGYFLYGSGDPLAYGIRDYLSIVRRLRTDPVLAPLLSVVTPVLAVEGIAGNFRAGVSRTVAGLGVEVAEQNRLRLWNDYRFSEPAAQLGLSGSADDAIVTGSGVARVLRLCGAANLPRCVNTVHAAATVDGVDGGDGVDDTAAADGAKRVQGSMPGTAHGVPVAQPPQPVIQPADITWLAAAEAQHNASQRAQESTDSARLQLLVANAYGAPDVADLKVIRMERKAVKELDDTFVQMHLQRAQQLVYGDERPQVTSIIVQLHHTADMALARARMRSLLGHEALDVLDFKTLNPQYGQITGMFRAVFGFIALLIATIVLFTVSNTMNLAVLERTVEIGTLRALGMRRATLLRMFMFEGLLLGLCSAVLGVLLALLVAALVNRAGWHWTPPGQLQPVALNLRIWGETPMLAPICLAVIVVALVSSCWPAARAVRLNIVQALHVA
ncbi:ABC transporter permease [Paraburkholderia hayleyella]|uniref:ABC transporter permease n=1 Tax=Paraburkholderia hayleyella TaxID=2152889 RepID=UPI001291135A|nr:FtsX-like permease family protein [Paraburkholderia hayleyella]